MRRLTDWLLWGLVIALLSANLAASLNVARVTDRIGMSFAASDAHAACRAMGYVRMDELLKGAVQ